MQQPDNKALPQVPLSPDELRTLREVTRGYLTYKRRLPPAERLSPNQIQTLTTLSNRLKLALASVQEGQTLSLNFDEVEVLLDAFTLFIGLIRKLIPPSASRRRIVAEASTLRERIALLLNINEALN